MSVPNALSRNPQPPEVEPPCDDSQELLAMASAANDPEADLALLIDWKHAQQVDFLRSGDCLFPGSQEKASNA